MIQPDVDAEYGIRAFQESKLSRRRTEDEVDPIPCFFALHRYCSCRPNDPLGLHLLALICERIGHMDLAISSVEQCIGILEAAYEESENSIVERQYTIASTTLGRLLLSAGQHDRSLESFQTSLGLLSGSVEGENMAERVEHDRETTLLRVQAHLGMALAHFMSQDYPSSLASSQTALGVAGDDLSLKAQIMILMTQTLWALGTDEMKEAAKTQLLE
jgi:superkiller protein 3